MSFLGIRLLQGKAPLADWQSPNFRHIDAIVSSRVPAHRIGHMRAAA
jgi:hypothetical protein